MTASRAGNADVQPPSNMLYRGRRPDWNARDLLARATIHVACRGRSAERITGNSEVAPGRSSEGSLRLLLTPELMVSARSGRHAVLMLVAHLGG
jgi:hypothetical protein